jgi:hypothetical protein
MKDANKQTSCMRFYALHFGGFLTPIPFLIDKNGPGVVGFSLHGGVNPMHPIT